MISTGSFQGFEKEPSDWIESNEFRFMPDHAALVVIKGIDDPRVKQTLKNIQEARAHPLPDPNAERTAQPATWATMVPVQRH